MSRITLSPSERIEALGRFSYTPREAAFLVCAALQSGFFLRRQYCQFIHKEVGGTAAALIEKVLTLGHANALEGCRQTQVYHLGSRPFYAALGEEDNRNRRMRPPVAMKNKLMCLDLVLDHPEHSYLVTEQEKVTHFTRTLGISHGDLPAKEFRSPTAVNSTARYFVDKYPIALASDGHISFCFVDEGLATGARFESYLKQYAALFSQLTRFELNHKYQQPHLVTVENLTDRIHRPSDFPVPQRGQDDNSLVAGLRASQGPPKGGLSQSERDWAFAKRALARGEPEDLVTLAIAVLRKGEKHDVVAYAQRTVQKASLSLQRERDRTGMMVPER